MNLFRTIPTCISIHGSREGPDNKDHVVPVHDRISIHGSREGPDVIDTDWSDGDGNFNPRVP
ncbi:hypothetical protein GCWU000342_00160 [Shuttleworthella satelles DSM 14600]|uniref:Uncharacterized protein n=1 Tax=Shuttleworthella satelles DSM 14600 TaxID=626523 RepID=C4G7Z4_9FIRM|nr:hypothetical protein GCWU000342_00160 [Shuttleworthia satelles DSM 14600]